MRLTKGNSPDSRDLHDTSDVSEPTEPTTDLSIAAKLGSARQAARRGERQLAYQLSRDATLATPGNVQAWLYRAAYAKSFQERLSSLSKALRLRPEYSLARTRMYDTLRNFLSVEPSLHYVGESKALYQVRTQDGLTVAVPKDRTAAEIYPPARPTPLRHAYRWLLLSIAGLLFSGLGTLIFAPLAASAAWDARSRAANPQIRRRAALALLYTLVVWMVGLLLSILFVIHL